MFGFGRRPPPNVSHSVWPSSIGGNAAALLAGIEDDHDGRGWWYYTVELEPGLVREGIYPPSLPMLPRVLLEQVDVAGADCLDIGTMEGLIAVVLKRRGAKHVLAVDAVDHCLGKLRAVQRAYDVDFDYRTVGLMYGLDRKIPERSFDLVNLSGFLYHVLSPLMILSGVRPLVKRDGILIVSTNVVVTDEYTMHFNDRGRMQVEPNTFWYLSVPLLDYLLRYLRLAPLELRFLAHESVVNVRGQDSYVFDKPSGYLSVACRAVDEPQATADDAWMGRSVTESWEYLDLVDWERVSRQPRSQIRLEARAELPRREDTGSVDLLAAIRTLGSVGAARTPRESHCLLLADV